MIQHRYEAATIAADGSIWHLSWISISSSLRLLLMEPRSHLLTPGMLKFWESDMIIVVIINNLFWV